MLQAEDYSDKSYVTLLSCPICQGETGELLLDRRLKPTFHRKTVLPYSVCENCKKTYLKKGTLLIVPTSGRLVVLKDSAFKRIFKKPIPPMKICYVEDELIDKLQIQSTD